MIRKEFIDSIKNARYMGKKDEKIVGLLSGIKDTNREVRYFNNGYKIPFVKVNGEWKNEYKLFHELIGR